jgi:hypothetical protein
LINSAFASSNTESIYSQNLSDGRYRWNVICTDGYLQTVSNSSNFYLETVPRAKIQIFSTENSAQINISFSEMVSFNFTSAIGNYSNSSFENYSFSFLGLSASANYNYVLEFCDSKNNCNSTNNSFVTQASHSSGDETQSCFDNIQNQDEEGIDCGGICTTNCPRQYHGGGGGSTTLISSKYLLNLTDKKTDEVKASALDKVILIFQNKTYVLIFSNTSLKGTNVRFYPLKYNVDVSAEKDTRTYLSNSTDDVVFHINSIVENEVAYKKYGIKDYLINITGKVVKLEKPKPVVNEPPVVVKNITIEEKAPGPKFGKIAIKAKSGVYRPASQITGFVVAGMIIVAGLLIYLGLRKIFWS